MVAVVGLGGEREGVGDQGEDGGRGGRRGEDEGRARVDDGLAARVGAAGGAVHGHGVERDLPVAGFRDGDLRGAAFVARGVAAAEAEGAAVRGPGCGAAEVETEFGCGLGFGGSALPVWEGGWSVEVQRGVGSLEVGT